MNLSSAPANSTPDQFRRCQKCSATGVYPYSPSTALPCKCGGELTCAKLTADDIIAERKRCADALERLAVGCEEAGRDSNGMVDAAKAAQKMRDLALYFRSNDQ